MGVLLVVVGAGVMFLWHKRNQELKELALGNPLMAPGLGAADIKANIQAFGDDLLNAKVQGTEALKVYKHVVNDVLANAENYEEKEFKNVQKALEDLRKTVIIRSNVGIKTQNKMGQIKDDAHNVLEEVKIFKEI